MNSSTATAEPVTELDPRWAAEVAHMRHLAYVALSAVQELHDRWETHEQAISAAHGQTSAQTSGWDDVWTTIHATQNHAAAMTASDAERVPAPGRPFASVAAACDCRLAEDRPQLHDGLLRIEHADAETVGAFLEEILGETSSIEPQTLQKLDPYELRTFGMSHHFRTPVSAREVWGYAEELSRNRGLSTI